ncbi:MAG TPA: chemotaxis protein CheA [Longimicrobiales bacterium]
MGRFDQYLDLYLSEAQEHLGTLNRGLLELESGGGGEALDAAFRAAHTIKGMAAMMGHEAVAAVAHRLEDRLDHIRAGRVEVDPTLIDELLAGADELARGIDAAVAAGAVEEEAAGASSPAAAPGGDARPTEIPVPPDGADRAVRVVLAENCPLKAARAHIVCRSAVGVARLVGIWPGEFDEAFDGELWLFTAPGADPERLEAAIRAGGEVAVVEILDAEEVAARAAAEAPGEAEADASAEGGAASGTAAAPADGLDDRQAAWGGLTRTGARHVRVARRQLIDLADGMGDLAILARQLEQAAADAASPTLKAVVETIGRRVRELQDTVLGMRMVPAGAVFDRLPRVVRDTARSLGKEVDFRLEGRDIELDREILEELVDALVHILRNAIDHGLEDRRGRLAAGKPPRGQLVLRVIRERSSILIEVEDDGRGVDRAKVLNRARALGLTVPDSPEELSDEDVLRLLSQPGFSTADQVSSVSGRGVGMDVVVTRIRALGGGVSLRTIDGRGATFMLRMPITLALVQALRVRVGAEDYAVPITHVTEALDLEQERVVRKGGREYVRRRGRQLPIVRLRKVLAAPTPGKETAAIVTELGDRRAALVVDSLVGREQIIVKSFDAAVGTLKIFSGAALLSDGRPALVLDPISVI